ncbi:hypothetical protein BKA93DRAFT_828167 [Sparassis latifolia]
MKEYQPLHMVNSPEEFIKVFTDVVHVHHWVSEISNILHRGISANNIMFYREGANIYGVISSIHESRGKQFNRYASKAPPTAGESSKQVKDGEMENVAAGPSQSRDKSKEDDQKKPRYRVRSWL